MKPLHFPVLAAMLFAVIFAALSACLSANEWQIANKQANAKIVNYEAARSSGSSTAIRDATLQLQRDPLAVRIVNRTASDGFKTQLNKDIRTIQENALSLTRKRLTKAGIKPESIDFFEATNPPKPGDPVKVGQDWDLTVRVNGRDLPTKVSKRIAHDSYYEASTGEAPPPATDTAARARYSKAADLHARQQALAVTDYQDAEAYGGGPKEGGEIISGPKNARLRDPAQLSKVMDFKSAEARNLAAELRAEGKLGEAAGYDIEQLRQSTKQFDRQVKPRLEEMVKTRHEQLGREAPKEVVPGFIEKAQGIMKQVEKGEITPAEARAKLSKMGETPDTVIRKTAELVEAAEVLQPPGSRGEPAPDVFVENVKNRLQTRRIVKTLEQVEAGQISSAQAREQIGRMEEINLEGIRKPEGNLTGREPLTEGKSSVAPVEGGPLATARSTAMNALGALWIASTAGDAAAHEGQRAMEAGEAPSRLTAAGNAVWEATLLPGIARGLERGQQIGKEELAKAKAEEQSAMAAGMEAGMGASGRHAGALLKGMGRVLGDVTAVNLGSTIAEEEIAAEERRAEMEGREPSYLTSSLNGAVRGLGEVLMINTIARAANSVTEEEVVLVGQQQVIRAWAQAKLNEGQREINGIRINLADALAARAAGGDTSQTDAELDALTDRYDKARKAMDRLLGSMSRQLGENDPLVQTIASRVGQLPAPPDTVLPSPTGEVVANVPDAVLPPAEGEVAMNRPDAKLPSADGEVAMNRPVEDVPEAEDAGKGTVEKVDPAKDNRKKRPKAKPVESENADLPSASEFDGRYVIYQSAAGAGRQTPGQPFDSMTWTSDGDDRATVTFVLSSGIPDQVLQMVGLPRRVRVVAVRRVNPAGECYFAASGGGLSQTVKGIAQIGAMAGAAFGSAFGGGGSEDLAMPAATVKTAAATITPAGADSAHVVIHSDVIIQVSGNTHRFKKDLPGYARRVSSPANGGAPSRR